MASASTMLNKVNSLVSRPDGCSIDYNYNIYQNDYTGGFITNIFYKDFIIPTSSVIYYSPLGLNGNSGANKDFPKPASELKAFLNSITTTSYPNGITVYLASGDYSFSADSTFVNLKTKVNLICYDGVATLHSRIASNFVLESGNVYKYIWTGSNVIDIPSVIYDRAFLDEFENAIPLDRLETFSIPNLQANPNTFFLDVANKTVYIHLQDSRVPDSNVQALGCIGIFDQQINNHTLYFENIRMESGGKNPFRVREATGTNFATHYFFKNCDYVYSGGSSYVSIDTNTFYMSVTDTPIYSFNCRAFWSMRDGFNYNSAKAMEFNCTSAYNGKVHILNSNQNSASNGSTTHAESQIIRINGLYIKASDRIIQDINNATETWMLGCRVGDALKLSVPDIYNSCNYMFGSLNQVQTTKAWLDCCESFNNFGDLIVGEGTVVKMRKCIGFDTIRIENTGVLLPY